MRGVELIEPHVLYNLLNQTMFGRSRLNDDNFLALYDTRKHFEYAESHIITAKHVPQDDDGSFMFPIGVDLTCIKHIVVIDNRAISIRDINSTAVACAEFLWDSMSKYPIKVVRGGFEEFSGRYPFLRTQKVLYMNEETSKIDIYPLEVEKGLLYVGTYTQACMSQIKYDLKIKAHINVSQNIDPVFNDGDMVAEKNGNEVSPYLQINVPDCAKTYLFEHFATACAFIDTFKPDNHRAILVYSDRGVCRSVAVVMAYLMHSQKIPLHEALQRMLQINNDIALNRGCIANLLQWEDKVLGSRVTKLNQLGHFSFE